tara:strand:- start:115 stop:987 length:873 start_codon:yes stop_codon:yes gene_type:complete
MGKSFADDPSDLSGIGHENVRDFFEHEDLTEYFGKKEEQKMASYYYDYLAYLHLLLVKNGKKKAFVIDEASYLKPVKKLKIKWNRVTWEHNKSIPSTNSLPKKLTEAIIRKERYDDVTSILCSQDEEFLKEYCNGLINNKKRGEIEEYPTCCINSFIKNQWHEYEMVAYTITPEPDTSLATNIINITNGGLFPMNEEQYDHQTQMYRDLISTREKFPFVIHQACEKCLNTSESPSSKLNTDFQEFCKKEEPGLYENILLGVKGEILRQKYNVSISWEEFDEERWHPKHES